MLCINVAVESVLSYIKLLAVHDTFIMLKASVLVFQLQLRAMALGLLFII